MDYHFRCFSRTIVRETWRTMINSYVMTIADPGALGDGPPLGARGHEFRHSTLEAEPAAGLETAYEVRDARGGPVRREGYRVGGTLASYVHLHFGSCPELPGRLL